jgi:hypothetical protein
MQIIQACNKMSKLKLYSTIYDISLYIDQENCHVNVGKSGFLEFLIYELCKQKFDIAKPGILGYLIYNILPLCYIQKKEQRCKNVTYSGKVSL